MNIKKMKKPTLLIILDGYGYSEKKEGNAIYHAHAPHLKNWFASYPHALLQASGVAVGLPDGVMGNSEVGHTTIGAGKVIKETLTLLNEAIQEGQLDTNKQLLDNYKKLKQSNQSLHIIGLLSDGGVHGHIDHLLAFANTALNNGITKIFVHAITDGRDTPPQSAQKFFEQLEVFTSKHPDITLGSIHGRFFAMDRDNNTDRTQASLDVLTLDNKHVDLKWKEIINHYYRQNITDEFIPPTNIFSDATIKPGDGIIITNLRPDRARQLTKALLAHTKPLFIIAPIAYSKDITITSLFTKEPIEHPLVEQITKKGLSVFTIAETEKYAHVTYFLNGGCEEPYPNEHRVMIPSIKAKSYAKIPAMAARSITNAILESLKNDPADFYIINYANADMVGHSGDFQATVKAIECLDKELSLLYDQVIDVMDGTMYVTADHGNAEEKYESATHQPKTSHTTNPVPFIMIRKELEGKAAKLPLTQLADIAPFVLKNIQK
jgi:2,3-bisphosphoglycerate-independent phosphoglycerate mutase